MAKYNDNTVITFGKFKGEALVNIPAWWLLQAYKSWNISPDLREYIRDNLQVLEQENKKSRNFSAR